MMRNRHRRQEIKEGAPKAHQRAYYYMDYSHATDVIKWRMFKIQEIIDVKLRNVRPSLLVPSPQADQLDHRSSTRKATSARSAASRSLRSTLRKSSIPTAAASSATSAKPSSLTMRTRRRCEGARIACSGSSSRRGSFATCSRRWTMWCCRGTWPRLYWSKKGS